MAHCLKLKGTSWTVTRICCADDVQEGMCFPPPDAKAIEPVPGITCKGLTHRHYAVRKVVKASKNRKTICAAVLLFANK